MPGQIPLHFLKTLIQSSAHLKRRWSPQVAHFVNDVPSRLRESVSPRGHIRESQHPSLIDGAWVKDQSMRTVEGRGIMEKTRTDSASGLLMSIVRFLIEHVLFHAGQKEWKLVIRNTTRLSQKLL